MPIRRLPKTEIAGGTDHIFEIPLYDASNDPLSVTGLTAKWYLFEGRHRLWPLPFLGDAVLSKDSEETDEIDLSDGLAEVIIQNTELRREHGEYWQVILLTASDGIISEGGAGEVDIRKYTFVPPPGVAGVATVATWHVWIEGRPLAGWRFGVWAADMDLLLSDELEGAQVYTYDPPTNDWTAAMHVDEVSRGSITIPAGENLGTLSVSRIAVPKGSRLSFVAPVGRDGALASLVTTIPLAETA